jgi:hypothetical protein
MLSQGLSADEIEEEIASKLEEFDAEMLSIEFILDIQSIAETVQPETDNLLRGL